MNEQLKWMMKLAVSAAGFVSLLQVGRENGWL